MKLQVALEKWGSVAAAQTHYRQHGEHTVFRRLTRPDPQLLAHQFQEFIGAAQGAGQIVAYFQYRVPDRLLIVKGVKAGQRQHMRGIHLNQFGHFLHSLGRHIPVCLLRQVHEGQNGRLLVWKATQYGRHFVRKLLC